MIANLLVPMKRGNSVSETIAQKLIANGWRVHMASGKIARLPRLYEMLVTCLKYRREYNRVFVEVFSGRAFVWAEIVCTLLKRLKKPYVLGLFGGNFPILHTQTQAGLELCSILQTDHSPFWFSD